MNTTKSNIIASPSRSWGSFIWFSEPTKRLKWLALVPMLLLLSQIIVSYLAGSIYSHFFAWLAFGGAFSVVIGRKWGLSAAICCLLSFLLMRFSQLSDKTWYLLHATSLTGCWLVIHLCFEEIQSIYVEQTILTTTKEQECVVLKETGQAERQVWEEHRRELQEELQRLKEEAQQRATELEKQTKFFNLARSEIELLTNQKEAILFEAEELKKEARLVLEKEREHLHAQSQDAWALKEQVKEIERLKEEKTRDAEIIELLKHSRDQVIVLTEQLAKEQPLPAELQQLEQKLLAEEEKNRQLMLQLETLQVARAEQGYDPDWQRKMAKIDGMYKQLRFQFEEKSRVLDQTRQSVFKLEGELEATRLEQKNQELDGGEEATQVRLLLAELAALERETSSLAIEIEELEDLISQLVKIS